jgi:phytoene synthase
MMAVIMGVAADDEGTLARASDLGIAFQLSNIARDLLDDDAIGRCYLPEDWLAEMDVPPGQHMAPPYRDRMAVLAGRLCAMVERYEASARIGAARLPFRARWAVLTAAGIYGDIARQVAARGACAWDSRVVTTRAAKLRWAARSWREARQSTAGRS